jgi:hypothetical protein
MVKKVRAVSEGTGRRILLAAVLLASGAGARTYDVTAYGAKADGVTDNTAAIQKAIDACTAAGGGQVLVPGGGTYITYTLDLKNNVDLHLDRGATLKGGEDPLKYPEFPHSEHWNVERVPRFNKRAMFYTVAQTNVAITGNGTIDGNADGFHEAVPNPRPGQPKFKRKSDTLITGRCMLFVACTDVRVDDIFIYHPCGWCTWFLDCDRVQCRGVRIECHPQYPNGDGLHFGGCRDVTVSDCIIHSQDDSLIIRTHQEQMKKPRPCERVTIQNCVLSANQSAIRFGWTEDYAMRDVVISGIVCQHSRLGVQFNLPPNNDNFHIDPPRDAKKGILPPTGPILPFFVENVSFSNMRIDSVNAPIQVRIADTEKVDFIRNISFSNCRFTSGLPPVFECRPEDNVSNWRFSNVEFVIEKGKAHPVPRKNGGLFENCTDFTFDNVRWTYR